MVLAAALNEVKGLGSASSFAALRTAQKAPLSRWLRITIGVFVKEFVGHRTTSRLFFLVPLDGAAQSAFFLNFANLFITRSEMKDSVELASRLH